MAGYSGGNDWFESIDDEPSFAEQTHELVDIDQVQLGSRIDSKNPVRNDVDVTVAQIGNNDWQTIRATMHHASGQVVEIELLRPGTWVETNNLRAGVTYSVNLAELNLHGLAVVESIDSTSDICDGDGNLVTGRFVTRSAKNLIEAVFSDGTRITGTDIHPVWSLDRLGWIPLGDLAVGEHVSSSIGPVQLVASEQQATTADVYNIEVDCEHVYQIGEIGILVHNQCDAPVKAADLPWARAGAARAARAIETGQTSIKVASRDDAAELIWRMFRSQGYTDTTMFKSGSVVKQYLGTKAGTYHWDDVLDAAGNVAGHGAGNAHGAMRHVQIHLIETGKIIRIFFP